MKIELTGAADVMKKLSDLGKAGDDICSRALYDGMSATADALAAAVNSFIGAVCRMPHMQGTFATMDGDTRREYGELLTTVEEWAKGARKALNTAGGEGRVY